MLLENHCIDLYHIEESAKLRALSGADERSVVDIDTATAISLIDRLVEKNRHTTLQPGSAIDLPTAERDRILAEIYVQNFGDDINASIQCEHCEKTFDTHFTISNLIQTLNQASEKARLEFIEYVEKDRKKIPGCDLYILKSGDKLRLVTGRDEISILNMDHDHAAEYLFKSCVVNSVAKNDFKHAFKIMEKVAPVIDLDLKVICPECETPQNIHFNIQDYLLRTLIFSRDKLLLQVHKIAKTYRWSMGEIMDMPRYQRLAFSSFIDEEIT